MLRAADAARVAATYGLGDVLAFTGPVARGVIGQIWRLDTSLGSWAIKEWFEEPVADELEEGARFQEAAAAAGVPSPPVIRTATGRLLARLDGTTTRVQGWVELNDRDPMLDTAKVGRLVALLHQVPFAGRQPIDPWYAEPIGRDRWEQLADASAGAGAPFAVELVSRVNELVELDAASPTRRWSSRSWSGSSAAPIPAGLARSMTHTSTPVDPGACATRATSRW